MTAAVTSWLILSIIFGALANIAIWSRRPTRWRGMSVAAFLVAMLAAAVALGAPLGRAIPYWPGITVPEGKHPLIGHKLVEGIADMRDESDRDGVRLVIELKRDADAEIVLNQLYRHTALQTSFGVNMLALNGGRPELMDLKTVIAAFVAFREQVIARRTEFELGKARERAHTLVGLAVAVGVGFLGGGIIITRRDGRHVSGLTTAASIWATAAVGIAAGLAHYILAAGATVMLLVVLRVLVRFDKSDQQD